MPWMPWSYTAVGRKFWQNFDHDLVGSLPLLVKLRLGRFLDYWSLTAKSPWKSYRAPQKKEGGFSTIIFRGANCSTSGEYHLDLGWWNCWIAVFDRCAIPQEGWDGDIYLQRQLSSRWSIDGGLGVSGKLVNRSTLPDTSILRPWK